VIYTARQLEDLHKANGHVTLPPDARLSPLAIDWVRRRKIEVRYGESPRASVDVAAPPLANDFLWWCDGPCGAAKAAIVQQARQSNLREIAIGSDASSISSALTSVANEIRGARSLGAILLVQHGATATVLANRCPSLRAVLGTCIESVEHALRHVAANVLVIEHPHKTLMQVRNMVVRFVAFGPRAPSPEIRRQMEEIASCG
jgi:hypothetical protein